MNLKSASRTKSVTPDNLAFIKFSITARLRVPTEATQNTKPPKLHFIDLPSMRQMKAETEIRLLQEFQANRSNGVFQNQDSSFYPRKRRLSEKLYKSKCF